MTTKILRNSRLKASSIHAWSASGLFFLAVASLSAQGLPEDWSNHHLVFSNPGSIVDALKNSSLDNWSKVTNDPRFVLQQQRRNGASAFAGMDAAGLNAGKLKPPPPPPTLNKDWSMNMGSGAKVGAGQYPAKFSFGISSAFCDSDTTPDFVVFNTGLNGSGSQSSVIAYDNLYSGCSGANKPLIYWQYDIAGSVVKTSPVLSSDGSQVAFVATGVSGTGGQTGGSLVILKWKKGTSGTLPITAPGSYRTCTPLPCMTSVPLSGNPAVSNSSPFYDYANDVLYVGDNAGKLHKFINIFNSGTPQESGSPFATTGATQVLTSPVLDSASGNVFVGGSSGVFYSFNASTGTAVGTSGSLGTSVDDAPIVDSTAQRAYVFVGNDGTNNSIYQFATNFTTGTGTKKTIATTRAKVLWHGTFDNTYFNSANSASPTGSLYVCANSPGSGSGHSPAILYQVAISGNAMGAVTTGPTLSATNGTGDCSPVTELESGGHDLIFLSVTASASLACSGSGCIYSFRVESGITTSSTPSASLAATGGTSGIIIDNTVTSNPAGGSQVYYSTLSDQSCGGNGAAGTGTGGCAVQASQ